MIHFVLTSAIVSLAALPHSPEVNKISVVSCVQNPIVKHNINMVKNDNHISTLPSKYSHHTNTNYQFYSGHLLLYFFFLLIYLVLLFQVWLDYNLPRSRKDY